MEGSWLPRAIPFVIALVAILIARRLVWHLFRGVSALSRHLSTRIPQTRVWARAKVVHGRAHGRLPNIIAFVDRRFDHGRFSGFPLTLISVAAIGVTILLGGMIESLTATDRMVVLDMSVNGYLDDYRITPLVMIFAWMTHTGGSACLTAVAIVTTALVWVHGRRYLIAPLWIGFVGEQIATYIVKFSIARERPEFLTEVTALTPSFPSGHAAGAMAVYGFVAYAVAHRLSQSTQRFEVAYWATVWIALVGFSRVFLSVHYLSDVVAGFLVGGFWLLLGVAVARQLRRRVDCGSPGSG